jgi:hypothetical protein
LQLGPVDFAFAGRRRHQAAGVFKIVFAAWETFGQ